MDLATGMGGFGASAVGVWPRSQPARAGLLFVLCQLWLPSAQQGDGWEPGGWRTLFVRPHWELYTNFDDGSGFIGGILQVAFNWNASLPITDPRDLVTIDNFAGGSSGYVSSEVISLPDGETVASTKFVGDFKEHLEALCYPFDVQEMVFKFQMSPPGASMMQFGLNCNMDDVAYDANGNEVEQDEVNHRNNSHIKKCVAPEPPPDETAVGFHWKSFECHLVSQTALECTMLGVRQYPKLMKSQAFPAVAFTAMGFASFRFPHKLAMPRVATVMLALLSSVNKLNQVLKQVPSTGGIAWIEEVYLIAQSMMLINLLVHVFVLRKAEQGNAQVAHIVDFLMFGVGIAVFMLVASTALHVRECTAENQVPAHVSVLLVIGSAIWTVVVGATIVYTHRDGLMTFHAEIKRKVTTMADPEAPDDVVDPENQ